MAVEKNKETNILYKVQTGQQEDGDATYSTRTLSNINPAITADNVIEIATAIAGLQKYTLGTICRRDTVELVVGE